MILHIKRVICLIFIFIILIPVSIKAEEIDINKFTQEIENTDEMKSLMEEIKRIGNDNEVIRNLDLKEYIENKNSGKEESYFSQIVDGIKDIFFKKIKVTLSIILLILVVALITSLITNLENSIGGKSVNSIAYYSSFAIIVSLIGISFESGVTIVLSTVDIVTNFIKVLTPTVITMLISSGAISEAATFSPIIMGSIALCVYIYKFIIIPLIVIGFVLNFINALSDDIKLDRFSDLIKKTVIVIQGIMIVLFIGIITIRGITSTTIDQVTIKTVKFAMDKLIPVVGGALSDAIATVAGYSILIKNSVTVFGLIVLIVILIVPVVNIFVISILYKIAAAIIEPVSDKKLVNLLDKTSETFSLLMGTLIVISIMSFIICAIILTAGRAILGG